MCRFTMNEYFPPNDSVMATTDFLFASPFTIDHIISVYQAFFDNLASTKISSDFFVTGK